MFFFLSQITYGYNHTVNGGNELTPTIVWDSPAIHWEPKSDGLFYTIIFSDPDFLTRENPTDREVLHWMVGNIPGNDLKAGQTIVEYIGLGVPPEGGIHRYVITLYEQSGYIQFTKEFISKYTPDGRTHFKTRDFIAENKLGNPIAGNFYMAQYDDMVPKLWEQLGMEF